MVVEFLVEPDTCLVVAVVQKALHFHSFHIFGLVGFLKFGADLAFNPKMKYYSESWGQVEGGLGSLRDAAVGKKMTESFHRLAKPFPLFALVDEVSSQLRLGYSGLDISPLRCLRAFYSFVNSALENDEFRKNGIDVGCVPNGSSGVRYGGAENQQWFANFKHRLTPLIGNGHLHEVRLELVGIAEARNYGE